MLGLTPTERWQYSILDVGRGLIAAGRPNTSNDEIDLPGLGPAIPIRSARSGIIIALKALGLPPQAGIGVPLYCCPVVFKAIKAAGCNPVFIDVDPETFCLSPPDLQKRQTKLDAVIAVHMFGNLCNMPEILSIMNGKPVIEDCAQSLGSKLGGRASGGFSDVAVFSFRSGKYLSVGEGGALFSANPTIRSQISEMVFALAPATRAEDSKHVFITYLRSKLRSRPLWGSLGSLVWHVYNKNVGFIDRSPITMGRIYATDLSLVRKRLGLLESQIATQRDNADFYDGYLKLGPSMLSQQKPQTFYNRYMYPIIFPSMKHRDHVAEYLQKNRFSSSRPYEDVMSGAGKYYGYLGDCPTAESLLKRALVIPINWHITSKDRKRIADCINRGWAAARKLV